MLVTSIERFRPRFASPLDGVSADAWERFVRVLEVQPVEAVSPSGGLGAYDMRPRRLVELGYAKTLCSRRTELGRQVHVCEFEPPWTQRRFLIDPLAQRAALTKSMVLYHRALFDGQLVHPGKMSISGALTVLHVGGRGALVAGEEKLFESTRALYEAARGMF